MNQMILLVKIVIYLLKSQIYETFPDLTFYSIRKMEREKMSVETEPS